MKKIIKMTLGLFLTFNTVHAEGVSKESWVKKMKEGLPSMLCQNDYFKNCFSVTYEECVILSQKVTNECVDQYLTQLPATFNPETGKSWGTKIGACAGTKLELGIQAKKVQGANCR